MLAGQGGDAKYIEENKEISISYNDLFKNTESLLIDQYGEFEAYANRDSLKYRSIYKLNDIGTIYRGTIRRAGFCNAWNIFVQLGMTDDSYNIENSNNMSYREYVKYFFQSNSKNSVEANIKKKFNLDEKDIVWQKLLELDIFSDINKISLTNATPAQILEHILVKNWKLEKNDKDMIVMYHKFGFKKNNVLHQIDSTMVSIGEDEKYTAMAKTVGLPLAIAALAILNQKIKSSGVILPVSKEIYTPILNELKEYGIEFNEKYVPFEK